MKDLIKNNLKKDSNIFKFLQSIYGTSLRWKAEFEERLKKRFYLPEEVSIEGIMSQYALLYPMATFIQVGANDGKSHDFLFEHIRKSQWHGVLVEPVTKLFHQLIQNYQGQNERLHFENSAISDRNGHMTFYRVHRPEGSEVPEWAEQLSSFNLDVIRKHRWYIPQIEKLIIEEQIEAITLANLIDKYKLPNIQLIMIDTEGHDYEIIKHIDFRKLQTEIVVFEHIHISLKDYKAALRLLKSQGFQVFRDDRDIIALSNMLLERSPALRTAT